jgi:hypothetical protein
MTSAQTVVRGQDWWMGREARISQKLRACSPAVIPHRAPALPRDAPPKNRENREKPRFYLFRGSGAEKVAAASPLAEAQLPGRAQRATFLRFAPQAYFFWEVGGKSEVARLRYWNWNCELAPIASPLSLSCGGPFFAEKAHTRV